MSNLCHRKIDLLQPFRNINFRSNSLWVATRACYSRNNALTFKVEYSVLAESEQSCVVGGEADFVASFYEHLPGTVFVKRWSHAPPVPSTQSPLFGRSSTWLTRSDRRHTYHRVQSAR
nr:hypothetical protein GCM10017745_16230 [Saccharothrix mutabilis subsp. capreolus]